MIDEAPVKPRPDPPLEKRPVAVVFNGRAGALLDRSDAASEVAETFAAAGLDPTFIPNAAGTLPQRVLQAARTGAEFVVVAGGDGTIACAAQVLAGTDTPLGILPSGTMNLLAKDLGIPIGDMDAAIALLAHGKPRRIDVGEVGGRVFLCASMLGLPADLGRHREAQRAGGPAWRRWVRFAGSVLRTAQRYVARRLLLEFPDGAVASRAPSITVVVNRLDDSSGRLFARTRLDGGEFGVHLAQRPRLREIVPLALDLLRGDWHAGGVIEERRAPELTVRARRRAIRVMNDGEAMILPVPLRYRIRPAALSVIAPVA